LYPYELQEEELSKMSNIQLATQADDPVNAEAPDLRIPSQYAAIAPLQPVPFIHDRLSTQENARFLHLVTACARITTHYELFLLVQGELQYFLPQDILLAAWGDFGAQCPQVDVISSLSGMRTDRICENIVPLAKRLHHIWVDGGMQPIVLKNRAAVLHACTRNACARPCAFSGMDMTLVHGTRNVRDGYDSLYIALRRRPFAMDESEARQRFLADAVIQQVDVAYRKVATLRAIDSLSRAQTPSNRLSVREEEITHWVCQGKTNAEIAQLLGISVNTVKNHIHQIFRKLGANNRTEAVVKYIGPSGSTESIPACNNQ
jgi:transcriptional regulator EpsA